MSDTALRALGNAHAVPQFALLVLVNGAPASGKSTLAGWLARELALPLVAKDAIKEVLFDTLGAPDRARSRELGIATYALLCATISWLLDAQVGIVVDCNFHQGRAEALLQPLVARARTVVLHCQSTPEELERRYARRAASGERHPGHHDSEALHDLVADLSSGTYEPLQLDVPTLRVDTTNGYTPGYEAITEFILSSSAVL